MNFEQGLRYELVSIPELSENVFPIYAKQETQPPFLVYKKKRFAHKKNLNGFTRKVEAEYILTLIARNYEELQTITNAVIEKTESFLARKIGVEGPYIENLLVWQSGEKYEFENDFLRSDIEVTVNY